jgi:hypothetical protein
MNSSDDEFKLNLLVAYPYMNKQMIDALQSNKDKIRFVLDSGAFTAWKAGKPIALDDYCKFIDSLPFKPWRYFTLDVIGDPEGTIKNYETMLSRGYKPVPIFTRGEDIKMLDKYFETSDVVGIGGLVGTPKNKGFVNGIMKHVGKRKVHWLGFTSMDYVKHYKPYMCDSSSFDSVLRFATLSVYKGSGQFYKTTKAKFTQEPSQELRKLFDVYNEDIGQLSTQSNWVNTGRNESILERICYKSAYQFQKDLFKNTNVKLFYACTTAWKIKSLVWAQEQMEGKHQ